jgi:hypothetical protein
MQGVTFLKIWRTTKHSMWTAHAQHQLAGALQEALQDKHEYCAPSGCSCCHASGAHVDTLTAPLIHHHAHSTGNPDLCLHASVMPYPVCLIPQRQSRQFSNCSQYIFPCYWCRGAGRGGLPPAMLGLLHGGGQARLLLLLPPPRLLRAAGCPVQEGPLLRKREGCRYHHLPRR